MHKERYHYIDWLRIIAFSLLIFLHCAVAFTAITWEVNNKETSNTLTAVVFWLHQWRLPLLFFVSGLGIHLSLKSRTIGGFFWERFTRLFIPLVFAMFFTIPLQPYFEFLQDGKIEQGYWQFYQGVWRLEVYPDGPLTWSHMWFIVYLIAFIILLLPLFLASRINFVNKGLEKAGRWAGSIPGLVIMLIPLLLIFHKLYLRYPINGSLTEDWFAFIFYISFLIYGFLIGGTARFWDNAARWKWWSGSIAVATAFLLFSFFWKPMPDLNEGSNRYLIYTVLDCTHIWSMMVFACGMARSFLNFSSPALTYLNRAVYPYYIIHQTIIVVIGYYIIGTSWPVAFKLPALVISSLLLIMATYHFLIRKTRITRFLYGMKR